MFFNNWEHIVKIVLVGAISYISLIIFLRVSGKRILAQSNPIDFIGTVAIGSTLSMIVITDSISLVDGLFSFAILIFLQFISSSLTRSSKFYRKIVHAQPRLLFSKGKFHETAMKEENIVKEELLHAVRENGYQSLDQVGAIVLEINGMFSILQYDQMANDSALENVRKD